MPEQSGSSEGTRPAREGRVLLLLIVSDPGTLDQLITTLLDIGAPGATVIESKGMASIIREEMPIFSGLAHLLPERTGSRVLLSVMMNEKAEDVLRTIDRDFKERDRPIALVIPLARVAGIRN